MMSFLLEEGVLSVGTMSGLFTAAMLNSFRINILEPVIEKIVPGHKLDSTFAGSLENIINPPVTIAVTGDKNIIKWQ